MIKTSDNKIYKLGSELQVGDVIEVLWGKCTITEIKPYVGTLWNNGLDAVIAEFATRKTGMTIDKNMHYRVYN